MAQEAVNNQNVNIFTNVLPLDQAGALGAISSTIEFEDYSNNGNARKLYISRADGGRPIAQDIRTVDVFKYDGFSRLLDNAITRDASNEIQTPSDGQGLTLPCYSMAFMQPAGTTTSVIRVETTFDFDIEFFELGRLPQLIGSLTAITWSKRT